MLPLCLEDGIGVLPWSPLARGRLTRDPEAATERSATDVFGGKLYARFADADRLVIDAVADVAKSRGVPRAQVALAWLIQKPGITSPIVGASKPTHLEDAVAALTLGLTAEEIERLERPYVPHEVAGFE